VIAGLERHVCRSAAQARSGVPLSVAEGDDFGMVDEVVFVPAFADDLPGAVKDHAAYGRVGRGNSDAAARELQRASHPVDVLVELG
jgi:hypothetical protein